MTATSRRSGGAAYLDSEVILLWSAIVLVVVGGGVVDLAAHLGARIDGRGQDLPSNPLELLVALVTGTEPWPRAGTPALIGILLAGLVLSTLVTLLIRRLWSTRSRVDRAAAKMGRGRALEALTLKSVSATAARLGVADSPGLPIAVTVAGNQPLRGSWEDVWVAVAGPRTSKTTSLAVPAILNAPGAVLATSNKRDLADATRDVRATSGEPVWVFDPQGLVGENAAWWWNPLSYVTDEVKAQILADVFALAARDPGARTDAYFDSAAQGLLANLLLAAALAQRPLTTVYLWLSDPTDDEPVLILRKHDYPLSAAAVAGIVNAPEKQRGGVYGTAQQIASFMTNREAMRWVTPNPEQDRKQFGAHEFVRTKGTLYSVSKEGRGSAGPLVTALTVAVTEAAEDYAKVSPGGRLPTPMVAVLDEAANVVRWRELPNIYSHYGSRGIILITILQSWSQGVEVWGRDGMRKLWSAANIRLYGGGLSEPEFLGELSQLIGDFDLHTISVSHGNRQGRSVSHATRRERVLEISDLAALPKGRAIVFASGTPAVLVRTQPWMSGPHADAVRASIRAHDPAAETTLAPAPDFDDRTALSADRDGPPVNPWVSA